VSISNHAAVDVTAPDRGRHNRIELGSTNTRPDLNTSPRTMISRLITRGGGDDDLIQLRSVYAENGA